VTQTDPERTAEAELQPWQWPEATWRRHVERVRAGRSLRPEPWPGSKRVAVALSFDSDHETIPLREGDTGPGRLAQGQYGARAGVPRILALLTRYEIPATFFIPAVSALLHPEEVDAYCAAGHEVALHGWIHERNRLLPEGAEVGLLAKASDVLAAATGSRPVGVRTPSWDFRDDTLSAIRQLGLVYDSSLMADDDCYELVENGEATGVIEIPVEWIRDDAVYFPMERYSSLRPLMAPGDVADIWAAEFDQAWEERGLFQLTMHPHVIGHRSRIAALAKLLDHILERSDDVLFATHAAVAQAALAAGGPQ